MSVITATAKNGYKIVWYSQNGYTQKGYNEQMNQTFIQQNGYTFIHQNVYTFHDDNKALSRDRSIQQQLTVILQDLSTFSCRRFGIIVNGEKAL